MSVMLTQEHRPIGFKPGLLDESAFDVQAGPKGFSKPPALAYYPNAPLVELTHILQRANEGEADAREELLAKLYEELHHIAQRHMRGQPMDHTLQATALVNEAWMRLDLKDTNGDRRKSHWSDRQHFLALASKAMRCVLVDHSRRRNAQKRQRPGERVALDRVMVMYENRSCDIDALDHAMRELEAFDPTMAKVVELRFFGGLDMETIATLVDVPKRTLERRWTATRSWLKGRIQ